MECSRVQRKFNAFRSRYTSCVGTSAAADRRPAIKIGQLTACPPKEEGPLKPLYRGQAGQYSICSKESNLEILRSLNLEI